MHWCILVRQIGSERVPSNRENEVKKKQQQQTKEWISEQAIKCLYIYPQYIGAEDDFSTRYAIIFAIGVNNDRK